MYPQYNKINIVEIAHHLPLKRWLYVPVVNTLAHDFPFGTNFYFSSTEA
jgi:hypothetical protein